MAYPEKFLRGISNKSQFDWEENRPTPQLFQFSNDRENKRDDGWIDESINWLDHNEAIQLLLGQTKKDGLEKQFKCGAAVMRIAGLKWIQTQMKHLFSYERDRLPSNKYHGNLLVNDKIEPRNKKLISSWLVLFYEEHIQQTTIEDSEKLSCPEQKSVLWYHKALRLLKRLCYSEGSTD